MILNPRTNRKVKIGSQMHRKAIKDGILSPDTLNQDTFTQSRLLGAEPLIEKEITKETEPPNIPESFTVKQGVAELCTNIIADNKSEFNKLNQHETNELLKKLLYEKLYINVPENIRKSKTKSKSKKEKPKLKLKKYYSSSSSSDDDD